MDIEKLVREYIDKSVHMSLGTSLDGKPWVCEVHFAYDDDLNIYFRSLSKTRHCKEIAANPNVAGNINRQHALGESPQGVYFEGTAEHVHDIEEQKTAATYIIKRLEAPADIVEQAQDPAGTQFYKITVENFYVFGKFGDEPIQKYQLTWNKGA